MVEGAVIWATGLSEAGKTTLCNALWVLVKPVLPELLILDGDAVRAVLGDDLGYRKEDRIVQIGRIQRMAKVLSDQGMVVLVAALYSHPNLLTWNRLNLINYYELYLKVSLDTVRKRDSKGLYAGASKGEIKDVVGVDIPWLEPVSPDMVLAMDDCDSPENLARRVANAVPRLADALSPSRKST